VVVVRWERERERERESGGAQEQGLGAVAAGGEEEIGSA